MAIMQLNMLKVSDSLKIIVSNPTIGAVIPKLRTSITERDLRDKFSTNEDTAKANSIQLKILKVVWIKTMAEKLERKANRYVINGMRIGLLQVGLKYDGESYKSNPISDLYTLMNLMNPKSTKITIREIILIVLFICSYIIEF